MRERILKFIEISGYTAARFADDIGVQRSSVSHILSGRNNPSFDFIQKILLKYKQINAEWLLLGMGDIFKEGYNERQPDLFHEANSEVKNDLPASDSNQILNSADTIFTFIRPAEAGLVQLGPDGKIYLSTVLKNMIVSFFIYTVILLATM